MVLGYSVSCFFDVGGKTYFKNRNPFTNPSRLPEYIRNTVNGNDEDINFKSHAAAFVRTNYVPFLGRVGATPAPISISVDPATIPLRCASGGPSTKQPATKMVSGQCG